MHPVISQNIDTLHELLLRSVPVGLVILDGHQRILAYNAAAERLLGLSSEMLGRPSQDLIPDIIGADGEALCEADRPSGIAVRERRDVNGMVIGVRRPDTAQRIWLNVDLSVHFDAQGEIELLLSAITDLSASRARESENRMLSMVAQHTDNAVVFTDVERRVKWANRAFEQLTGWTLEEARGRKPGDLLQGEQTDLRTVALMRAQLDAGKPFRGEILNYHRDGRPMWLDLEIQPLFDEHGHLEQWMGIKRDITSRRTFEDSLLRQEIELRARTVQLQAALERARVLTVEAERADRAKATFLRNMNHEVRTPLNGLLGGCSLLEETQLDDEQMDYLRLVTDSADRLARTLGLALDFASHESLHGELAAEPFEVGDVLRPLAVAHGRRIEARGLEFRLCMPSNDESEMIGDAARLRQVLAQLLDNAQAFTQSGWIELGASVRCEGASCHLRFWVEDTGCGIAVEDRERVFGAFEQGDTSTTRAHEGAGLGLSVARQLVQRMGGCIRIVESTTGGARLEVDLELTASIPLLAPIGAMS